MLALTGDGGLHDLSAHHAPASLIALPVVTVGATLVGVGHARHFFPMITTLSAFLLKVPFCKVCRHDSALVEIGCFMNLGPVQAAFLAKALYIVSDPILYYIMLYPFIYALSGYWVTEFIRPA